MMETEKVPGPTLASCSCSTLKEYWSSSSTTLDNYPYSPSLTGHYTPCSLVEHATTWYVSLPLLVGQFFVLFFHSLLPGFNNMALSLFSR